MNLNQYAIALLLIATASASAQVVRVSSKKPAAAPVSVPQSPRDGAQQRPFRDTKYGVRFDVPAGWNLNRKDGEVSVFRLDARTATHKSLMRSVASIDFNPYPLSVLSGAMVYFSVEPHATEQECATQAATPAAPHDVVTIGGMDFQHGHDEHGGSCVEARDEVYTAYRRGACYRFDLELNTFCSIPSGAKELTEQQMTDLEQRMTGILSTVKLDWEKTGPTQVPTPTIQPETRKPLPRPDDAPAKPIIPATGSN